MRDMLDSGEPYPLSAWSTQFDRIRVDLNDALERQAEVAVARRTPEQRAVSLAARSRSSGTPRTASSIWRGADSEEEARSQIRLSLQARQAALSTPSPGCSSRTTKPKPRRQARSRTSTIACSDRCMVPGGDARGDCRHEPVPDPRKPARVRAARVACRRAPRASRSSSSRPVSRRCARSRGSCTTSSDSS